MKLIFYIQVDYELTWWEMKKQQYTLPPPTPTHYGVDLNNNQIQENLNEMN